MLVLAEHASTRAERIALLKEVVSIGRREFMSSRSGDVTWWWTPGTRTIMAALAELGDELAAVGDADGASRCFRLLLEIDPQDRLQARTALEKLAGAGPTVGRR
jgi:hypothetical protein